VLPLGCHQVGVRIFHDVCHVLSQMRRPLGKADAALQQKPTNLIDQRRAALHQSFADTVERLQVELIFGIDFGDP
jgi:hypothetical protein